MSTRDLLELAGAAGCVFVLVVAAAMFPIYRLLDGSYVRRPVWDPPALPIGHGYDDMKQEDIDRLSRDPQQRQILENMRDLPRSYPATPIFVGSRRGPDRNVLGYFAMLSVFMLFFFAGHKWFNRG